MRYFLIVFAFHFLSCIQKIKPVIQKTKFDLEQIKKHIITENLKYADRFIINDTQWYAAKYCKDACVMANQKKILCGHTAILNHHYDGGKNKIYNFIVRSTNIYGCEDLVVEEGLYELPNPKGGIFDKGKFITIWKPENSKWKIFKEIYNSDLPITKK